MSHAILGSPAAEVRKLQNLVDDGRRLRAQLRRVARALDKADPRERIEARIGLDTIARRGRGWSRENRALLVSLVVHYYPPDRLAGLPRELLEDAVLANLDVKNLAAMAAVSRAARLDLGPGLGLGCARAVAPRRHAAPAHPGAAPAARAPTTST